MNVKNDNDEHRWVLDSTFKQIYLHLYIFTGRKLWDSMLQNSRKQFWWWWWCCCCVVLGIDGNLCVLHMVFVKTIFICVICSYRMMWHLITTCNLDYRLDIGIQQNVFRLVLCMFASRIALIGHMLHSM